MHVACHSYFNKQQPLLSGISLAGDEIWSAADVLRERVNYRLAILSCCNSGEINDNPTNEALSLPGLAIATGCAGVVSSLWQIYDLSTTLLIIRFFDFLLDHNYPPQVALAHASTWLLRSQKSEFLEYVSQLRKNKIHDAVPVDLKDKLYKHYDFIEQLIHDTTRNDLRIKNIVTATAFYMSGV